MQRWLCWRAGRPPGPSGSCTNLWCLGCGLAILFTCGELQMQVGLPHRPQTCCCIFHEGALQHARNRQAYAGSCRCLGAIEMYIMEGRSTRMFAVSGCWDLGLGRRSPIAVRCWLVLGRLWQFCERCHAIRGRWNLMLAWHDDNLMMVDAVLEELRRS
mmetsp:Transcript_31504/g.61874  ORF Transcript_31504/g.61874 Transcript_31504/m.61874 type:complete len:158 (+) Transcript_31504:62-535(+)